MNAKMYARSIKLYYTYRELHKDQNVRFFYKQYTMKLKAQFAIFYFIGITQKCYKSSCVKKNFDRSIFKTLIVIQLLAVILLFFLLGHTIFLMLFHKPTKVYL
jgi:hypothetical protein